MGKKIESLRNVFWGIKIFPHILQYKKHKELNHDLILYTRGKIGIVAFIETMRRQPTFRNLFYYRVGRHYRMLTSWLAPDVKSMHIYGVKEIGYGAHFEHSFWTYFNAEKIGNNFYALHNVTIGKGNDGVPTIGDNVRIYANAVIFGKIKIGNNVRIGAGAVVNKNTPDNCTIVGNPAYITKLNGEKVHIKL